MGTTYTTIIKEPKVTKALNNIKNNIAANSTQACSSGNNNYQSIRFGDIVAKNCNVIYSDISQDINTNVNSMCVQDDNFKEMLETAVSQEMMKLREEGETKIADQIQNIIDNNINIDNVAKCMSDVYNSQILSFGKVELSCPESGSLTYNNISQTIASDLVFTCAQIENPSIIDKFNNVVVSNNEVKEKKPVPHSGLTNEEIIGLSVGVIMLFLVFVLIIIGMYMYLKRGQNPISTNY